MPLTVAPGVDRNKSTALWRNRGYPRAVNNLAVQALTATYAASKAIVDETPSAPLSPKPPPTNQPAWSVPPPSRPSRHQADQRTPPRPAVGFFTPRSSAS
ncbi:hypothetical protein GCM10027456_78800 [Kineosporia babensis]